MSILEDDMSFEAQHRRHKARLSRIADAAKTHAAPQPEPPQEPIENWVERQRVIHKTRLPSRACPSIEQIRRMVAKHFGITVFDLESARRNRDITRPRQVVAYLCRILTARSFPEIGSKLGGRDHTTILHAVRIIAKRIHTDKQLAASVVTLIEQLGGMPE